MKSSFYLLLLVALLGCSAKHADMPDRQNLGTVEGRVTIGPICPVERIDQPCEPPPEMYAKHKLAVLKAENNQKVAEISMDAKGYYRAQLPDGDYLIDFTPHDVGIGPPPLKQVHINAGQTAKLDIDIDTGIR